MADKSVIEKEFSSRVNKSSSCWIWNGSVDAYGYGQFNLDGKQYKSHRLSYQLYNGEIGEGLCVLHRCDNPPCVNPKHLFLGTVQDNIRDKVSKGRHPRGNNHGNSKLNENQVRMIRRLYSDGTMNQYQLSGMFGVNQSVISRVIRRSLWGHI